MYYPLKDMYKMFIGIPFIGIPKWKQLFQVCGDKKKKKYIYIYGQRYDEGILGDCES